MVPSGSQHHRSLTQRREKAVPGAGGGQRGARLGEKVPAGLGRLPAGHVGELGSGPRLRAGRGDLLKDGVFDALSTAAGEGEGVRAGGIVFLFWEPFLSPGVLAGDNQGGQGVGSGGGTSLRYMLASRGGEERRRPLQDPGV